MVLVTDADHGLEDSILVLPEPLATQAIAVWNKWRDACIVWGLQHNNIDPAQVAAMIWRESAGNPNAFRQEPNGWTGVGLLQITHPSLKAGKSDDELRNPSVNLEIGCRHIASLTRQYGDFPRVSAAFNAGSPRGRAGDPWNLFCTGNHVDAEVRCLNTIHMRERSDTEALARRAVALQFDLAQFADVAPHAHTEDAATETGPTTFHSCSTSSTLSGPTYTL